MWSKVIAVVLAGGGVVIGAEPFGAIETRAICERGTARDGAGAAFRSSALCPAVKAPTLWEQTERALDRGNGRIVDEQTYTVESIRADRVLSETQRFWVEREWQVQMERVQQKGQVEVKREKIVERESERLAVERERWIRMMNKPRHGEAAVVDEQMKRQGDKVAR